MSKSLQDELDERTDLVHKLTEVVRVESMIARDQMWKAISERNWPAIAGLTVMYDKLSTLSKTLDSMVEKFSRE